MTRWRRVLVVAVAALSVPGLVESCGPFLEFAQFTTYHGTFDDEFASDRFGVLRPHYYRADLVVAYRMLNGVLLSNGEIPGPVTDQAWPDRVKPWLEARNKVSGVTVLQNLDGDKPAKDYQYYYNCLEGAFQTAAETLGKRIAQWGASSPQVAEWLRGQDTVLRTVQPVRRFLRGLIPRINS